MQFCHRLRGLLDARARSAGSGRRVLRRDAERLSDLIERVLSANEETEGPEMRQPLVARRLLMPRHVDSEWRREQESNLRTLAGDRLASGSVDQPGPSPSHLQPLLKILREVYQPLGGSVAAGQSSTRKDGSECPAALLSACRYGFGAASGPAEMSASGDILQTVQPAS